MQAVVYTLLASDRWCDNVGGAERIGSDFDGYSLAGCQAQCTKDHRCAYISFNSNDGWCSKYVSCGTPTDAPNPFPQDPRGWATYAKPSYALSEDFAAASEWFGGCELVQFQRFKHRAAAWYDGRSGDLRFFQDFSTFVNNFDFVLARCAPAALTAVLLKLESAYFEERPKWDSLLEIYITRQHQAVADGSLLQSHHQNGWPLEPGISRVLSLRALGLRPGSATAPDAPAVPPVNVIICYCAERLAWLRGFHKLPWRDEDRSAAIKKNVALHIYHKCGGFGRGVRDKERRRLVDEWSPYFRSVSVRYVDDVLRADDDSAYLAYIVDHYEKLPEFSVFLHADAPEHIPALDLLTDTVFAASRGYLTDEAGFVHFAHNYVLHELGCSGDGSCEAEQLDSFEFTELWKNVFGSSIAPSLAAGDINAYCCVQFMVHRSRIRLRPKAFYERNWRYFGTTAESYHRLFPVGRVVRKDDVLGRTPGQLAMYIWHVMFGEALKLPRRQRDPRLPLFMKIQNVEVEALGEEADALDEDEVDQLTRAGYARQGSSDSTASRLQSLFDVAG